MVHWYFGTQFPCCIPLIGTCLFLTSLISHYFLLE